MNPYRTAGFRCPSCRAALREFQDRLVCDECRGLLIAEVDFATACADLISTDVTLAFGAEHASDAACPRCERAMTEAEVQLVECNIAATVLRCARDGLWMRADRLAGVFALVGRQAHGATARRYYAPARNTGLDGLPQGRRGPASAGLRISQWRDRPRRRTPTLTPVNVYRDQRLPCPACTSSDLVFLGDRWSCATCAGTFVQNPALEAMATDIAHAPWTMPPPTGDPGSRGCPVCGEAMIREDLERVPIDRCATHGVWFDHRELAVALERASGEFEPRGLRAWLGRLFST